MDVVPTEFAYWKSEFLKNFKTVKGLTKHFPYINLWYIKWLLQHYLPFISIDRNCIILLAIFFLNNIHWNGRCDSNQKRNRNEWFHLKKYMKTLCYHNIPCFSCWKLIFLFIIFRHFISILLKETVFHMLPVEYFQTITKRLIIVNNS